MPASGSTDLRRRRNTTYEVIGHRATPGRPLTVWGYAYRYPSLEDALEPEPSTEALVAALQTIHRLADNLRSLIADNKKSE